jgi:hypothetical protein
MDVPYLVGPNSKMNTLPLFGSIRVPSFLSHCQHIELRGLGYALKVLAEEVLVFIIVYDIISAPEFNQVSSRQPVQALRAARPLHPQAAQLAW